MKTLRIGVASMADIKVRTRTGARGELRLGPDEPKHTITTVVRSQVSLDARVAMGRKPV